MYDFIRVLRVNQFFNLAPYFVNARNDFIVARIKKWYKKVLVTHTHTCTPTRLRLSIRIVPRERVAQQQQQIVSQALPLCLPR